MLLLIDKNSRFELKARTGTLTAFDYSDKHKTKVAIKFKKSSMIYKLLSGYSMLKENYKKPRLIAITEDESKNSDVTNDKELKSLEKKYKKLLNDWTIVHKNSFGIK